MKKKLKISKKKMKVLKKKLKNTLLNRPDGEIATALQTHYTEATKNLKSE